MSPALTFNRSLGQLLRATGLSWLATLGFDFLLHGGLLAGLYQRQSPFLLPPLEAFRRVPLGYLSFLILAALLTGLMAQLEIDGLRRGAGFGLLLGAMIWGALCLGLYSISSAAPDLLWGWFAGQTLELGLAGAVVGADLGGMKARRLILAVIGWVILAFVLTVALQSLGLAPVQRL